MLSHEWEQAMVGGQDNSSKRVSTYELRAHYQIWREENITHACEPGVLVAYGGGYRAELRLAIPHLVVSPGTGAYMHMQ